MATGAWSPPEVSENAWTPPEATGAGPTLVGRGDEPDDDLGNALFDLDGAPDRVGPSGKAAFASLQLNTDNSRDTKAQAVNQAYVMSKMPGVQPDLLQQDWPAFRDAFAKSFGHTEGTISEGKFYELATQDHQKTLKGRWATGTPMERLKLMFGSHGYGPTEVEGPVPMVGSEAAGTKGGAFTIPKMEGTGAMVGIINAANKLTSGLTTPENAGIAVATGGAGALAELAVMTRAAVVARSTQAAALGTFTAIGAKDTVEALDQAKIVMNDPLATNADKADAIATAVLSGAMTIAAAKGTYDFAGTAKTELGAMDANKARMESIARLREQAAKADPKTAETLNKVADEIEALPPVVETAAAAAEKPKAGEATVEDLDGGGFVVTDKDGNRAYAQERAEAYALAKELGAKAPETKSDRAEYDRLQGDMPPPQEAVAAPVEVPVVTERAKTPEAVRDTVETAKQAVIGIKNASVDEALAKMGMEPATHGEKLSFEQARTDAASKMEADPMAGQKLIAALESEPRPVTGKENALLLHELTRLTNERAAAETALIEATKMGDALEVADAKMRVEQATADYVRAADIDAKVGTANAIGLSLRRMMMKEDYSLAAMERRRMVANEGKPLSEAQKAEVVELHKDIAAKEQAMTEARTKRAPSASKGVVLKFINEQASAARERIKARQKEGRAQSGLDPVDLADHAIIGAEYIAKGTIKLAEWSEQMVKEFGEAIKPHLKAIYDASISAADDARAEVLYGQKKARLQSTIAKLQEKVDAGDTSREPVASNRPSVREIEALEQKRDSLQGELARMREVETKIADLKTAIEEKTRKIERDDISTKGQPVNRPSVQEIETLRQQRDKLNRDLAEARKKAARPTDAERIQKEVDALKERIAEKKAAIESGDVSPKGTKANRPAIQAIEEAKQELADLNRQITELRNPKKTPEQARLAKIEGDIARLEEQIASGEIFPKGKKPSVTSPEIKLAEKRLEDLVAQRDNLRESIQPSPEPKTAQEKRLSAFKSRREAATEELKRRIDEGDFEPKPKPDELHLDEEANRLQAEYDLAKLEYDRLLARDRYEKSSTASKIAQQTLSVYDAARMLMTTGEFSFILRQGKVGALSHPVMTAKAIPDTIRAFMEDPAGAHALALKTLNHPDMPAAKAAKLHIIEEGAKLTRQEEMLVGAKLAEKIPILGKLIGRFEQAATVFLNKLRFDMWNQMRKVGMTAAEEKQLAMFVNEATGRGGLGSLEQAAVPLARVMFSPRFFASRIQLATGHSLWGGTWATRRVIAGEYARTLIGLGLYYSALKLAYTALGNDVEIGEDPRSSDFGKVKIGNTRLDPLAGVAQVAVFGARTISGEKTNTKGRTTDIRGPKVPFGGDRWTDVAARFARSKLHPVPGAIANLFDGTDLGGNEATFLNQGANMVGPVTYGDIYQALEEQDLPEGVSLGLLALLGEGVQTYDKKPAK